LKIIKIFLRYSLPIFFLSTFCSNIFAQGRVVTGKVIDSATKAPLVSCSVYSLNSGDGVITDEQGKYTFSIDRNTDSIAISMIGYKTLAKPVTKALNQEIDFEAVPLSTAMQAVIISLKSKYTRAQKLIKKVIKNKPLNNVFDNQSYQCQVYDKIEIDFKNIPEKLQNSRLMKPLAFAFNNMDTTKDNQKILPVYLSESNADFYFKKNPRKERYNYTAIKSSGLSNKSILTYLESLYNAINIYDNNIKFMDVNYVSPIAENALIFYNYQILDTVVFDHLSCIQVQFSPKAYGSNTFNGYMWITDTSFAVKSVVMHIDKHANVNFLNNLEITQNFQFMNHRFLPQKNILYVDLKVPELRKTGAIINKTTLYRDAILNNKRIDTAFDKKKTETIALSTDSSAWTGTRFEPLSNSENAVYKLMDTLNKMPVVLTYKKIISALSTGYLTTGRVDLGNIYSVYTNNQVEGNRYTFGLQTNHHFNENIQLWGYAGLSTRDKQLRYLLSSRFVLTRKQWSTLDLTYTSDISEGYEHQDELDENSIFASFLRRVNYSQVRLLNRKDADIKYKKYFDNGIGIGAELKNSAITPFFNVYYTHDNFTPYIVTKPGVNNDYKVNAATFSLRFSHREKYITEHYYRESLGSNYPIITLNYTAGIKVNNGLLQSDFNYSKWDLNLQHDFTDGRIGQLSYTIDAGLTNGILPVVLLDVQKGNDTYYYNKYAFNNMNRYEFASDKYVSLSVQQSFGSFPFKYFPLLKRLKWRSLVTFKGVMGAMSEANKIANGYYDTSINYHFTIPDRTPYMETGVGIDNIFHLIRIDAIWRLNYLNNPGICKFGLKGSLELKF
jgi:hypothetical protein